MDQTWSGFEACAVYRLKCSRSCPEYCSSNPVVEGTWLASVLVDSAGNEYQESSWGGYIFPPGLCYFLFFSHFWWFWGWSLELGLWGWDLGSFKMHRRIILRRKMVRWGGEVPSVSLTSCWEVVTTHHWTWSRLHDLIILKFGLFGPFSGWKLMWKLC